MKKVNKNVWIHFFGFVLLLFFKKKKLEFFHLEGSWEFDSVKLWHCVSSVTDELVFHFYLFLYLLLTCSGWKCVSWHGGVCTSAVSSLYLRLCWKSSWGPGGRLCCTSCSGAVGHYKRNRDKDKSKWLTGWGCYTCTLIFFQYDDLFALHPFLNEQQCGSAPNHTCYSDNKTTTA